MVIIGIIIFYRCFGFSLSFLISGLGQFKSVLYCVYKTCSTFTDYTYRRKKRKQCQVKHSALICSEFDS